MPKLRLAFVLLAVVLGIGLNFVQGAQTGSEKLDKLFKRLSCPTPPGCEYENQYVYWQGQMYLLPNGGYGSTWVCTFSPDACTYAYMYCAQWNDWRFFACRIGAYCKITPYGCQPYMLSDEPPSDTIVPITDEQRKFIEEQNKILKEDK